MPLRVRSWIPCMLLILPLTGHAQAQQESPAGTSIPVITTSVRRVVVDVVVTDAKGEMVRGLTGKDFQVAEDGKPQTVLSFDRYGFEQQPDYMPPKLPATPPNTFFNLPSAPEKGPLYILLLDLVNMDNEDQMAGTAEQHSDQIIARQQLVKFIQSKPEGSRFAIFVFSDGLHLVQGFTSDRTKLYEAVNPHVSRPHVPEVFLMGRNFGRGDPHTSIAVLNQLAGHLDSLPGRKNLIWFSGGFPLALSPSGADGPEYSGQIKATLNRLTQDQVAIYPVDCRGVVSGNWHGQNGMIVEGQEAKEIEAGEGGAPDAGHGGATDPGANSGVQSVAAKTSGAGVGNNLLLGSYSVADQIAQLTGGRAFYSSNDVAGELTEATHAGEAYYTLSYAPTNKLYNGKLRNINVSLPQSKGDALAYRRAYFGVNNPRPAEAAPLLGRAETAVGGPSRGGADTLTMNMEHGAPDVHQLVFAVQVHADGAPPASEVHPDKRSASTSLRHYLLDYTVFTKQFASTKSPVQLEVAAAAFNADGKMLNSVVDVGQKAATGGTEENAAPSFRMEQQLAAPPETAFLRFAVLDDATGRVGALEIKLPLASMGSVPQRPVVKQ